MKNKKIFIILFVIFLVSCDRNYRINTLQDVEDTIEIGNRLVKNIEKYKNKYGKYPEKLEDLVPEFYDKVPKTKMIYKGKNNEYFYEDFRYDCRKRYTSKYSGQYIQNGEKIYYLLFNANLVSSNINDSCSDSPFCYFIMASNEKPSETLIFISNNFYFSKLTNYDHNAQYRNKDFDERLTYHFRNQLKYPYIKVQITE